MANDERDDGPECVNHKHIDWRNAARAADEVCTARHVSREEMGRIVRMAADEAFYMGRCYESDSKKLHLSDGLERVKMMVNKMLRGGA